MAMRYLFLFFVLLFVSVQLLAFSPDPVKQFDRTSMRDAQCLLLDNFSSNKMLDDDFLLPTLVALSYYPELKDTRIRIRQKNIKTTMQCLPAPNFLFRRKAKRAYRINIDNKVKNGQGLLLSDVPFNAQVGVIGHELAHVVDYNSRSKIGIVTLGIGYLFPAKRRQTEHRVDEITIAHGLGYQVKDFSEYVINCEELSEKYRRYKLRYYYRPEELMQILLQHSIY